MTARALRSPLAQRIARLPRKDDDPLSFAALRESAMELAQQASGELWTDFNLHDPGVTLLEALCYALTEEVFASRQSVPEMLGLPPDDALAACKRHALLPPTQALPCRPCSAADYLRWLHDQLPTARHLGMQCEPGSGLWQMRLMAADPAATPALAAAAQRAYWQQRNLGEDLATPPRQLRPEPLRLALSISIRGGRDLIELLGELMLRLDEAVAALPRRGPSSMPSRDGPAVSQGHIDTAELQRVQADWLYLSDLARELQDIDGLESVHRLRLLRPGQTASEASDALRWRDADSALALQWPRDAADLSLWQVRRRDSLVQLPVQQLLQHLADLQHGPQRVRLPADQKPAPPALALAEDLPGFYPASAQLPPIYRYPELLRWHSDRPSDYGPGQMQQWQGYLGLLELPLAQAQTQRQHLGEFYALDAQPRHSYWWNLLGDAELPGISALYLDAPASLQTRLDEEDEVLERRGRVLDHLLALQGESVAHHSLQGLPCYLPDAEWRRHLHALKCHLAAHVRSQTQQRHAGIDYSQPSFDRPDNTAPLQQRLALQLGMARLHSHSLMRPLQQAGLQLAEERSRSERSVSEPQPRKPAGARRVLRRSDPAAAAPADTDSASLWRALAAEIALLRQPIAPGLLRCAAQWHCFSLADSSRGIALCLGPDAQQQHWTLAEGLGEARALALAARLHAAACRLQFDCEGLHLVEHVLLRPWATPPEAGQQAWERQISLVFPAWTARCADKRMRRLARDAALQAAPAHLHCRLLWLDAPALQRFEVHYQSWLLARQRHSQALLDRDAHGLAALTRHLDARALALSALLRESGS